MLLERGDLPVSFGTLLLEEPEPNPELDDFLEREGYDRTARLYHQVSRCWCGGSLAAHPTLPSVFDAYRLCGECGCLVLKYVATREGLDELYGVRYFREHQRAVGLPPLESRWHTDAIDRIPVWLRTIGRYCNKGSILEIGSSHGRFLLEASRAGYRATGLELDSGVADWARQKNDGVDLRTARIEDLQETDFDVVFAADVLEHVYSPQSFVAESARVLRVGGHALFHTVVFEAPEMCAAPMARPLFHTVLYSRRSLMNLQGDVFRCIGTVPGLFGCQFVVVERTRFAPQ